MAIPKLTLTNDQDCVVTIWLEPWGEDYWMQPGETFEFVADEPHDDFHFSVVYGGRGISVYAEGGCAYVLVHHQGRQITCGHHRQESA